MINKLKIINLLSCFLIIFVAQQAQAQKLIRCDSIPAHGDFVILKNGDRLSGEISKIQRGDLYFKGSKTGESIIGLSEVSYLIGRKKLYEMYVAGFGTIAGNIDTARISGKVKIRNNSDTVVVSISDLISLRSYKLNMLDRITGQVEAGYSYSKGSDITRFIFSDEFSYLSRKWQIKQGLSGIYTAGEKEGFERINASAEANRQLNNRWVLNNGVQYQKIIELGVKSRIIGTTSLGKMIIQNKHVEMDIGSGLSAQKEYATDGTVSDFQTEIPVILNFRLFRITSPNIRITSSALFYNNLSVENRYRVDYKLTMGYSISKLTINSQFYYNHDSKPLSETTATAMEDYGWVLTFGYRL